MGGSVVDAVGGHRDRYCVTELGGGDAGRVVSAFRGLGVREFYLADLDGISGRRGPDQLSPMSLRDARDRMWWWDGGSGTSASAGIRRVVASEWAERPDDRAVVGLDYCDGEFVGGNEAAWLRAATAADAVVLLDVRGVGTGVRGDVIDRCDRLRRTGFTGTLISGGGVRHDDDVRRYRDVGVDRVLVGSALRRMAGELDALVSRTGEP